MTPREKTIDLTSKLHSAKIVHERYHALHVIKLYVDNTELVEGIGRETIKTSEEELEKQAIQHATKQLENAYFQDRTLTLPNTPFGLTTTATYKIKIFERDKKHLQKLFNITEKQNT